MHDIRRHISHRIQKLLTQFPAVAILGARQVGKSTLLKQLLPHATYIDLEKESQFNRLNEDPEFFLKETTRPVIFDEAQLLPKLFNALRVKIDDNRKENGQFLLSGSSSPTLLKNISESLAGRIAILELGTFSWDECLNTTLSNFFKQLVSGDIESMTQLPYRFTNKELLNVCLYGGYPEPFLQHTDTDYYDTWMSNYFKTYIERDVRSLFPGINNHTFQKMIRMLAFNSGNLLNISNIAQSLDISQPTAKHYIDIAHGTFIWRTLPSFETNKPKQLIKMPKGHIRDTGLLNYLLNISSTDTLKLHPQFGKIWEISVIEHLIKGLTATATDIKFHHFRTRNHAEIDLIIEGRFGLIPIEIKAGSRIHHTNLQCLKQFTQTYNSSVGILINQSEKIEWLSPKILQVPASFL